MYSLTLKHGQPLIHSSSKSMKAMPHGFRMKTNVAPGFFKSLRLENGIQCLCAEYNPKENIHLKKMPLSDEFFILRIDKISRPGDTLLMVDRKLHSEMSTERWSVFLLSSLDEFNFLTSKNSKIRTLELLIPCHWFLKQLNPDFSIGLLKDFMAFKTRKSQIDENNLFFKNLFLKILGAAKNTKIDLKDFYDKVQSLLSSFFLSLNADLCNFLESEKVKISKDEITRLIAVRKLLDTDLPTPSFNSLTKIALMSGTSLKTKFKKMYGITVFEYLQKMRMQRAKILLLTHKYSVKEIGHRLGYSNLSNFAIAFKKEFNQLPHELLS